MASQRQSGLVGAPAHRLSAPAARSSAFRSSFPALPIAAIGHALLLAWLAFATIQHFDAAQLIEQPLEVELETPEQFAARTRPPATPPPVPAPLPAAPSAAEPGPQVPALSEPPAAPERRPFPQTADGLVHARRMMSQQVLADPRSRDARAMLPRLAPEERVEQLCGLEAMGQIHDWQRRFEPDRVNASATGETRLADHVLAAQGAAFRSRRRWYALRFACTLSPDLKRVTGFAFHVGEPIPPGRWEELGLAAVH